MKTLMAASVLIFFLSTAFVFYEYSGSPETDNFADRSLRSAEYKSYWERGKAEITRFNLEQARYGEIHKGEAVFIFVHEPFLPQTQVKYDGISTDEKPVTVLKHISTRNFFTGIYPYSAMTSVFSPVFSNNLTPLKITSSSQDWCGQSFMQLNSKEGKFDISGYSYFQKEGDAKFNIKQTFLEDEIWSRIRINPESLPIGNIEIVPSTKFVNLLPKDVKSQNAFAEIIDKNSSAKVYNVDYVDIGRRLEITYESEFPHKILEWKEIYKKDGDDLVTKATLVNETLLDYWNYGSVADSTYRQEFGVFDSFR